MNNSSLMIFIIGKARKLLFEMKAKMFLQKKFSTILFNSIKETDSIANPIYSS